ncbi:hypothetical protein ACIQVL_42790 [Streptomyces sp. NPDC090499]|uniref:hypothetical protein n=1 Tax=unclassified Streptomyces TaxID=2593676 RepID=UPI003827DEE8
MPAVARAVGLGVAGVLLLAGCGGEESDGTGEGAGAGASDSPGPTATAAADRPVIEMPSDLSYRFDWPRTGEADKDAVLADSERSIKAVDLAIVHQDAFDEAYRYYYEGEAAAGTQKFVQNYVDHKAGITGAYRFYDPEVAVAKDGTASLSYCEDQGKAYVEYLTTGKVRKTKVTAKSYVSYRTELSKNAKGVWVISRITSEIGSAACQP